MTNYIPYHEYTQSETLAIRQDVYRQLAWLRDDIKRLPLSVKTAVDAPQLLALLDNALDTVSGASGAQEGIEQ